MVNLYSNVILPRLIDYAMKYEALTELRAKTIPAARGVVLEVGIGSGLNLPFYSPATTRLYGVDPSAELLAIAEKKKASVAFPTTLIHQPADRIPLADETFDTVVVTWSLCSMNDPAATLKEMKRVLRRDGTLIFVEHGLSPDPGVQSWQNRLTPLWCRIAGGCHLNRKMDDLVRSAGFSIATLDTRYIAGPRPLTFMYAGTGLRS